MVVLGVKKKNPVAYLIYATIHCGIVLTKENKQKLALYFQAGFKS